MGNFFDCIRSRKDPICDVQTGHESAMISHWESSLCGLVSSLSGIQRSKSSSARIQGGQQTPAREMRKPSDYSYVGA